MYSQTQRLYFIYWVYVSDAIGFTNHKPILCVSVLLLKLRYTSHSMPFHSKGQLRPERAVSGTKQDQANHQGKVL